MNECQLCHGTGSRKIHCFNGTEGASDLKILDCFLCKGTGDTSLLFWQESLVEQKLKIDPIIRCSICKNVVCTCDKRDQGVFLNYRVRIDDKLYAIKMTKEQNNDIMNYILITCGICENYTPFPCVHNDTYKIDVAKQCRFWKAKNN